MKRKIALLLTLFILCAAFVPLNVFAADDMGLTSAINAVKEKIGVPAELSVFTKSMSKEGERTIWYLNWSSKDGMGNGVSARVDDKGTIIEYSRYKSYDYSQKKLPKLSKDQAKAKAEEFIQRINPEAYKQVRFNDTNSNSLSDYAYNFSYTRVVNDIPFYGNTISVAIDRDTGETVNYFYNWTDNLVFPDPKDKISLKDAQKAYKDELGLELVYRTKIQWEANEAKVSAYAVYQPKYAGDVGIDAFTGKKVEFNNIYPYFTADSQKEMAADKAAGAPVLTPEEEEAVKEVSGFINLDKAEKIARDFTALRLTDNYKLYSQSLRKSWYSGDNYIWELNFSKEPQNKDDYYRYVYVVIDALSGEILSFDGSDSYDGKEKPKYNQEQSRKLVEEFLNQFKPDKFKQTEYKEIGNPPVVYASSQEDQEQPTYYTFYYMRKANGIPYTDNYMRITFNTVTGNITSYNMSWYNVDLPDISNVMAAYKVYGKLFNDIGLELQYKVVYPNEYYGKVYAGDQKAEQEVKLVYALKTGKPAIFDANTGAILNSDGTPYKETAKAEYTDIAGNFAEDKIKLLAEFGVSLEGTEFKPDEAVAQKDFFRLLSKVLNYYYEGYGNNTSETDAMYAYLIHEGIVREGERSDDAAVTKEDAVKFFIRAMKYDKIADIKGIYNCQFKDADQINPDLVGYAAIAQGLKLISGDSNGMFNPQKVITRAETIVLLYNYLTM